MRPRRFRFDDSGLPPAMRAEIAAWRQRMVEVPEEPIETIPTIRVVWTIVDLDGTARRYENTPRGLIAVAP